jgi:hypothetical protein
MGGFRWAVLDGGWGCRLLSIGWKGGETGRGTGRLAADGPIAERTPSSSRATRR